MEGNLARLNRARGLSPASLFPVRMGQRWARGGKAMFNLVMRLFSSLLGLLVIFVGLVWIGQGLHVGPAAIMQGFMVNDRQWALYGAILALFGVGQVIWSNRRG
jgi:hypothetical protein